MLCAIEALVKVKFTFQYPINPLGTGVLIAMVFLCHAHINTSFFKFVQVPVAAVLDAPIGAVHQPGRRAGWSQRYPGGPQTARPLQRIADVIPYNLAGEHIGNERQIAKAINCSNIGYIRYPSLVRSVYFHVFGKILYL